MGWGTERDWLQEADSCRKNPTDNLMRLSPETPEFWESPLDNEGIRKRWNITLMHRRTESWRGARVRSVVGGGRYIAQVEGCSKTLDVAKANENLLRAHTLLRGGSLNAWRGTTRHIYGAPANVRRRTGTMSQGLWKRMEASKPGNAYTGNLIKQRSRNRLGQCCSIASILWKLLGMGVVLGMKRKKNAFISIVRPSLVGIA